MTKCEKEIADYSTNWPRFRLCEKKATITRNGVHYCTIHDPEYRNKKDKERYTKQERKWNKRRMEVCGPAMAKALKRIADGDNDPRATARETLGDIYQILEDKDYE